MTSKSITGKENTKTTCLWEKRMSVIYLFRLFSYSFLVFIVTLVVVFIGVLI